MTPTALTGGPLRILDSPVRFMEARAASGPPSLRWALLPVALNALLVGSVAVITQSRFSVIGPGMTEPVKVQVVSAFLAIPLAALFGMVGFAARAGIVVAFDVLTSQSGQATRIIELVGLAYWTQLIWAVPAVGAMWFLFDPPPMAVRGQGADLLQASMRYGETLAAEPLQVAISQTQQMFGIWLVALNACALRIVGKLTTAGTCAAAIVLGIVFIGTPLAASQIAERIFF